MALSDGGVNSPCFIPVIILFAYGSEGIGEGLIFPRRAIGREIRA